MLTSSDHDFALCRKNKFIPSSTAEIMTLISPSLRCMSRLNYANFEDEQLDIESYAIGEFVKDYQRKSKVRDLYGTTVGRDAKKGSQSASSSLQQKTRKDLVELNIAFRVFVTKLISAYPLSNPPKEFTGYRFYTYLKDTLEKRITEAINARELVIRNKTAKKDTIYSTPADMQHIEEIRISWAFSCVFIASSCGYCL